MDDEQTIELITNKLLGTPLDQLNQCYCLGDAPKLLLRNIEDRCFGNLDKFTKLKLVEEIIMGEDVIRYVTEKEEALQRLELEEEDKAYWLIQGTKMDEKIYQFLEREFKRLQREGVNEFYTKMKTILLDEGNLKAARTRQDKKVEVKKDDVMVIKCYGCDELGHIRKDCPKKEDRGRSADRSYVDTSRRLDLNSRSRDYHKPAVYFKNRQRSRSPPRRRSPSPRPVSGRHYERKRSPSPGNNKKLKRSWNDASSSDTVIRCNNCLGFGHKFYDCKHEYVDHKKLKLAGVDVDNLVKNVNSSSSSGRK